MPEPDASALAPRGFDRGPFADQAEGQAFEQPRSLRRGEVDRVVGEGTDLAGQAQRLPAGMEGRSRPVERMMDVDGE